MATMILRMTVSTVMYLLITMVLWYYWSRHGHKVWLKAAVGIIYGVCSVISTHTGVNYNYMVLNVRDLGPLAAGLFFDPVSGIIAGTIGGVERYIAGTYFGIGAYTTISCSLSTLLAGFLAAILNVNLLKGKRPSAVHSLFIGMVMEAFHMYVILLTHRDDMSSAYYIVKNCSVPMIFFNGTGLMACSILILYLSGEKSEIIPLSDYERTPLAKLFYRRLLAVTMLIFAVNHVMDYNFQTRIAYQDAESSLNNVAYDFAMIYQESGGDMETVREYTPYITMTSNSNLLYFVYDDEKRVIYSLYTNELELLELDDEEYAFLTAEPDDVIFRRTIKFYGDMDAVCVKKSLPGRGAPYLVLLWQYDEMMEDQINHVYEMLLSDILLFTVLYLLIVVLVESLVCRNLKSVNTSLQKIIGGDLNEKISVRSSSEFSVLSDDINQTVSTLKGYIDESKKRMEEELSLAAFIQESALPHVFTFTRKDFEIYAIMKPARQVGGDFYDFFFTDVNKLALVIADVSGKGIPAAMFMMRAKTAIVNTARIGKSPSEVLFEVNNVLCEGNEAEMFVTAWIGIIDLETGLMKCANAGHEYPVVCRADGDFELMKDQHALVLAAMENVPMKEYTLQMNPGDRLFVYTDGVPEAIDKTESAYGTGRLVEKLNTVKTQSQKEELQAVYQHIVEFVGEAEQFDDITMLGFTYAGGDSRPGT